MRENAFVEAWKTQHRRVSMILGLTLLCAPSAISVYAENGVNDITVQAVMQTKTVKGTVLDENGEPLIGFSTVMSLLKINIQDRTKTINRKVAIYLVILTASAAF